MSRVFDVAVGIQDETGIEEAAAEEGEHLDLGDGRSGRRLEEGADVVADEVRIAEQVPLGCKVDPVVGHADPEPPEDVGPVHLGLEELLEVAIHLGLQAQGMGLVDEEGGGLGVPPQLQEEAVEDPCPQRFHCGLGGAQQLAVSRVKSNVGLSGADDFGFDAEDSGNFFWIAQKEAPSPWRFLSACKVFVFLIIGEPQPKEQMPLLGQLRGP